MVNQCSSGCGNCTKTCSDRDSRIKADILSKKKKIIGVVSGKGGVGKSIVTSMLAVLANRRGCKTAVLDADITGPSIPQCFGIKQRADSENGLFIPAVSRGGIEIMSSNLLLENPTDPVVWRGPLISGMVKQFYNNVRWGDTDVMFIDMPPGTGDVCLTVFESIPIDGIVVVTSPQKLVAMIVEKALKMAEIMNVPVFGIVENFSYTLCPDCGEKIKLFGESKIRETARCYNTDVIAEIPMDTALAAFCDKGEIENFKGDWLDAAAQKLLRK